MIDIKYGQEFPELYNFVLNPKMENEKALQIIVRFIITRNSIKDYDKINEKFLFRFSNRISSEKFYQYYEEFLKDIKQYAESAEKKKIIENEKYTSGQCVIDRINNGFLMKVTSEHNVDEYLHFKLAVLCISAASVNYNDEENKIIYDAEREYIFREEILQILEKYIDSIDGVNIEAFQNQVELNSFPRAIENIIGGSGLLEINTEAVSK